MNKQNIPTAKSQMAVTEFRSGRDVVAFTKMADGSNLTPLEGRPKWKAVGSIVLMSGRRGPYGINADQIMAAVNNNGYSLHKITVKVTFTETENSPPPTAR